MIWDIEIEWNGKTVECEVDTNSGTYDNPNDEQVKVLNEDIIDDEYEQFMAENESRVLDMALDKEADWWNANYTPYEED